MTLRRHGFPRNLVIAAVLILAALISLNIILDHKLGREAPVYIKKLSKETGYLIELRDIGLDPLFNIRLSGLVITGPSLNGAKVAEIKKITVDPGIISSLLERRLIINEVLVQSPKIWTTKDNIENLIEIIKKGGKEVKDSPPRFKVRGIKLADAYYHISPEIGLSSKALSIGINGNTGKKSSDITLTGDLRVFESELDFKGTVTTGGDLTSGVLDISTGELTPSAIKLLDNASDSLEAGARLNFEFSHIFRSYGILSVRPGNTNAASAESKLSIEYDLSYDPSVKTASLDKLDMKMNGLMEGMFKGSADINQGDIVFNINGNAQAEDLSVLKSWVPAMEDDEIEGSVRAQNLSISGSGKKGDIKITGGLQIDGLSFKRVEDDLGISGLNCDLTINQALGGGAGYPMTSTGNCTADIFNWIKTGEIRDITSEVKIAATGNLRETNISLSGLNGSFMDGTLTGSIGFDLSEGSFKLGGLLTGRNLNLKEVHKSVVPVDIEGTAETVTAKFSGGTGVYDADISFTVRDFLLSLSKGRAFRLSKARSQNNLEFKFVSDDGAINPDGDGKDTIAIKNKGLLYENLTFGEYIIKNGQVKDIAFSLTLGSDWTLNMASSGSDFEVLGKDISLSQFEEHLSIENSGREGFSGHVTGEGGKFKAIEFSSLEWDYKYLSNFIELSGLKADIGAIGRFETDDLTLRMGEQGGYPILSKFKSGIFTGLDEKINSETISGDFTINDPNSDYLDWEGNIQAKELEVLSQPVSNLHIDVMPSETGLVLDNITGEFLSGALSGKIDVDTTGPRAKIVSEIELSGASLSTGDMAVKIAKAVFDFSGLLPQNSLPEGSGKLAVHALKLTKYGQSYTYKGEINTKTEGETLFIEDGFIVDRDSKELRFTGKMVDSLNEKRQLQLSMPGISIPVVMNILQPLLPESMSQAKTEGQADLELTFYNLFYPSQRWSGKLGVLRGAYSGMLSQTELNVKEVYGTITIKDDAQSGNPLSSFMGDHLKLSKSIYQKFLSSIKDFHTSQDSDYLKIGELKYGIIKIEDIDCQLEVDRHELNLKKLTSNIYRGGLYGTGVYSFEAGDFNISFLFDEISLEAISKSISSEKDYITGRVNGLAWISGQGGDLNTINGPFKFWAINSGKEQRKVGEALLDKLGARERFILGSSRGYDNAEISGYINDGVITFKVFNISNSILGFKNLNIQADPRQNSISINHLISVIRELARRALTGGPTIETN
jgi:hypothetical protein